MRYLKPASLTEFVWTSGAPKPCPDISGHGPAFGLVVASQAATLQKIDIGDMCLSETHMSAVTPNWPKLHSLTLGCAWDVIVSTNGGYISDGSYHGGGEESTYVASDWKDDAIKSIHQEVYKSKLLNYKIVIG